MKKIWSIVCMCMLVVCLGACGNSMEKKLQHSWYEDDKKTVAFSLYDDGTCEIDQEYGKGKWSLLSDDQLKITNFYGESSVLDIVNLKDGVLTLKNEGGKELNYYEKED